MGFFKNLKNMYYAAAAGADARSSSEAEAAEVAATVESDTGWYSWDDIGFYASTESGENITPYSAFARVGTVYACVDRRATALAKLPFQVYKRNGSKREPATEHPLYNLLARRPNKYQSPMMYKKFILTSQLLWGFAIVYKKYNQRGEIAELIPWHPSEVAIRKVTDADEYLYYYRGNVYTEDEVIYMPYLSADGKVGRSPLSVARESAGAVLAMNKHLQKFYKSGAVRQGALVTSAALSPPAKRKLKNEWVSLNGGGERAGEPAILDNGLDFKDISLPLKDAEFIESKRLTALDIASIFNVPGSMVGLTQEKFSNLQEINDRFMQDVVQPDCINVEEAHNFACFLGGESDYYTKFNLSAGMRGSPEKRAAFYKEMIQIGCFTINDILALEEMNDIGELGDKHYFSLNFTTLDTLEKHIRIAASKEGGDENAEK